jgi:hypothetical protein
MTHMIGVHSITRTAAQKLLFWGHIILPAAALTGSSSCEPKTGLLGRWLAAVAGVQSRRVDENVPYVNLLL